MNSSPAALGIDIAKLKFDVCLICPDTKPRHKQFPNTAAGTLATRGVAYQKSNQSSSCLHGSHRDLRRSTRLSLT